MNFNKEFFNEHKKIIIAGCIAILLIISNVVGWSKVAFYNKSLERANYEVNFVRKQLETERRTVEKCRDGIGRIADGLSTDIGDLQGIISCLRSIAEEVEYMEELLYYNNDSRSSISGNDNNNLENE